MKSGRQGNGGSKRERVRVATRARRKFTDQIRAESHVN